MNLKIELINITKRLGNVGIVKLLLSIPGINPSLHDKNGNTPLIFAVKYHYLDIMQFLIFMVIFKIYEDFLKGSHLYRF